MFCTKCGHKNPDNYKFCSRCGNPLKQPVIVEEDTATETEPNEVKFNGQTEGQSETLGSQELIKEDSSSTKISALEDEPKSPVNQYDEDGNLILPFYDEPKKGKLGIILGIISAVIITAGGIVSYHYYIESVSFISPYLKSKPEIEVKNFAKNFAELVNQKNLTELKILYPTIAEADSIDLKYNPNEIKIENFNGETYIIRLSPKVLIKVKEDNDGDYKIVSSYGLFAYPQDKMDLAIKTGMFNSNLTDLEFNERIKDNNFFEYLNNKSQQTFKDILFVNPIFQVTNPNLGEGYFEITNKQDFEIDGTDYVVKISRTGPEINFNTGEISTYEIFEELPGVNLPPKGKGRINTVYSVDHGEELEFENIIWNNNDNIIYDKIIKFKGTEYDEYIKSGGKIILSPEQEAIKFLYTLYYNPEDVNLIHEIGDSHRKTYSDSMLDTFKKNNITEGLPKNYVIFSSEWNKLSDKIEELEKQSGDVLGFNYDIIWDTQDMVVNFEFSILNTEVKNPNLIVVKTKFKGHNKSFTLVKEKGNWRIDNIDNLKESMQETVDGFEE